MMKLIGYQGITAIRADVRAIKAGLQEIKVSGAVMDTLLVNAATNIKEVKTGLNRLMLALFGLLIFEGYNSVTGTGSGSDAKVNRFCM